jgi:hypothetical protein
MLVWMLFGLALSGVTRQALAQEVSGTFKYTGFDYVIHDEDWGGTGGSGSAPDFTISGRFSGVDRDGDSILERYELNEFILVDNDYLGCHDAPWGYHACDLYTFGFSQEQGLQFSGRYRASDEAIDWTTTVESGKQISFHRWVWGRTDEIIYSWTPATTLQLDVVIVPAPVPEPAHGAMLAGGLCVLAVALRRRRAKSG